jgi:peptide-methionine (S)-S-oxide reductase
VDFDPEVISYSDLVDLVLASHDPVRRAHRTQYASLVLAHDEEQLRVARERGARAASVFGRPLATRIEPLGRFWVAEDYHQKYYLRNDRELSGEFQGMFGADEIAFRESTAAARVNGYVAGDGTRAQLANEISFLGLSDTGRERLIAKVGDSAGGVGCSFA